MTTAPLPAHSVGEARFTPGDLAVGILLLPRNVLLGALHLYRSTISHVYGDVCTYYPSCSAYAVGSIQQHGAISGVVRALWRILRCNPWSRGGVDDPPPGRHFHYELTPHGFVVPLRKD